MCPLPPLLFVTVLKLSSEALQVHDAYNVTPSDTPRSVGVEDPPKDTVQSLYWEDDEEAQERFWRTKMKLRMTVNRMLHMQRKMSFSRDPSLYRQHHHGSWSGAAELQTRPPKLSQRHSMPSVPRFSEISEVA